MIWSLCFCSALFNAKGEFWYAHWNKRGMTILCFKYCALMVWHSKRTFYARCSRKSWSISLLFVSEWVIISLFTSYFCELCDLCLHSEHMLSDTTFNYRVEVRQAMEEIIIRQSAVYFKCNVFCLFFPLCFDLWRFIITSDFST